MARNARMTSVVQDEVKQSDVVTDTTDTTQATDTTTEVTEAVATIGSNSAGIIDAFDWQAAFNSARDDAALARSKDVSAQEKAAAAILAIHNRAFKDTNKRDTLWQAATWLDKGIHSGQMKGELLDLYMNENNLNLPAPPKADTLPPTEWRALKQRYDADRTLLTRALDFIGAMMLSHPEYQVRDGAQYTVPEVFAMYDESAARFMVPWHFIRHHETRPVEDLAEAVGVEATPDGKGGNPMLRLPLDGKSYRFRFVASSKEGARPNPYMMCYASVKGVIDAAKTKRVKVATVVTKDDNGRDVVTTTVTPAAPRVPLRNARTPNATSSTTGTTTTQRNTTTERTVAPQAATSTATRSFEEVANDAMRNTHAVTAMILANVAKSPKNAAWSMWSEETRAAVDNLQVAYSRLFDIVGEAKMLDSIEALKE